MSDEKIYHDVDGNPCTLDTLCRREPAWAANRIRSLQEALSQLVDKAESYIPYVVATLPKPCDGRRERTGSDGSRWGDCHMGRAGSSVNQLKGLLELARKLKKMNVPS